MARGSAMECAAVLDVLRATGIVPTSSAPGTAACSSASSRCTLVCAFA